MTSIRMENWRLVMLALMSGDVKWKCFSGFMRASLPLPSPWPPRCRVYWKTIVHGVNTRSSNDPGCFAFACARPSRETCGEGMHPSAREFSKIRESESRLGELLKLPGLLTALIQTQRRSNERGKQQLLRRESRERDGSRTR